MNIFYENIIFDWYRSLIGWYRITLILGLRFSVFRRSQMERYFLPAQVCVWKIALMICLILGCWMDLGWSSIVSLVVFISLFSYLKWRKCLWGCLGNFEHMFFALLIILQLIKSLFIFLQIPRSRNHSPLPLKELRWTSSGHALILCQSKTQLILFISKEHDTKLSLLH